MEFIDDSSKEVIAHEEEIIEHGKEVIDQNKEVEITVNSRPVNMNGKIATGAEIKQAAINQGVSIQLNFVLQEELSNGSSKIIGDADEVHLRPHLSFTAIAPDDNS